MYKKIYVFSPTIQATGGTELLQQLVYKLRLKGQDAYMVYTTPYQGSAVESVFGPRYNNPYIESIEDTENNIMIVSEAAMYLLLKYKNIQKAVWWLSVDFYGGSFRLPTDKLHFLFYYLSDKIYSVFDKQWIHLVQSQYAYNYCVEERKIPLNRVYHLSDYLSKAFIHNGQNKTDTPRNDIVLFNPKKGYAFTKKLMQYAPDIRWKPIQNMTSNEIAHLMKISKVYIDFGNHPGKDRIPREAAISGCCIITGLRGAANNNVDIPIPSDYKFEEVDLGCVVDKINDIFDYFDEHKLDFKDYVSSIKNEESEFESQIDEVFLKSNIKVFKLSVLKQFVRILSKHIVYAMKFGPTLLNKNN